MSSKTLRIAFYGKGGIGKSTTASNVSAALAAMGKKILHIGCDPKADSTRCLTELPIPCVLEQLDRLGEECGRQDLVYSSRIDNLFCVESGGPKAGRGCAGMGITAMEGELERLGILDEDWDVIVYDVLGDVVCGGFSVPMRKHYVDRVFIVSSSDFMSVYAANNILKAVSYYSGKAQSLFGGMIWNHVSDAWDESVAESFTKLTGAESVCGIKESRIIKQNDYRRRTFVTEAPDSQPSMEILKLADRIISREFHEKQFHGAEAAELEHWRSAVYEEIMNKAQQGNGRNSE